MVKVFKMNNLKEKLNLRKSTMFKTVKKDISNVVYPFDINNETLYLIWVKICERFDT